MNLNFFDTDWYKLTMGQAVWQYWPDVDVEYELFFRRGRPDWANRWEKIREELNNWQDVFPDPEILDWVPLDSYYKKRLKSQRMPIELVSVNKHGLKIHGPWHEAIFLETPVLAMISEVFHDGRPDEKSENVAREKLSLAQDQGFKIIDFGTRRRFSQEWHERVLKIMNPVMEGTSNVWLAHEQNLALRGTVAHEWIMAYQAWQHPIRSQSDALWDWSCAWPNSVVLTDTFGTDWFLQDFDINLAQICAGVRHDSGNPFQWADRMLAHYRELGINPQTKTLVFSDQLTFPLISKLWNQYKDQAKIHFGIGTNLTCDVPGSPPLDAVIKLTRVEGEPVAKLTDQRKKISAPLDAGAYLAYLEGVRRRIAEKT